MRTRSALLLCLASMAGTLLSGLLGRALPPGMRVWLGAAASVAFYALPAYLGLCEIDGDQRRLLLKRRLSSAQALWLAASGALLVCPATLLSDVIAALIAQFAGAFGARTATAAAQGTDGLSLFLPTLLASGVLAPLCEEVFFRGYLLGVFARYGAAQAAGVTALLFAAAHNAGAELPVYALLGLVLAAAALHTGSVLASVLVHMAYNVTLVLLAATPLSGLFTGLTPLGCALRLIGCMALCYTAKRAWLARGAREVQGGALALSKREIAKIIAALALVIAAQVTAMWAAGGSV